LYRSHRNVSKKIVLINLKECLRPKNRKFNMRIQSSFWKIECSAIKNKKTPTIDIQIAKNTFAIYFSIKRAIKNLFWTILADS
jgi:hypothetical protein